MTNEEVIGELSVLWNKAESEDTKIALDIAIQAVMQNCKQEESEDD